MADNYVLRVSGVPASHCKDDVLHDKLLIHFLQRKNGGDGQVHVQYPTKEKGVAMLTFDRAEVADQVLAMSHELQIEMSAFPLKVTRPQRETKVSMPIKTSLNLNYFDDFSEVRRLLCKHDLKIYAETPSDLFIEGDFLNLSQCRDDLYKIMNSSLRSEQYRKENTTSSVDKDFTTDHHRVSREVSVQKSSGEQSPVKGLLDLFKNPDRNPAPRPRRRSESSLVEIDGNISTGDNNRSPYIKPYLSHRPQTIHSFSSQWKAKDSSLYNSFSITKHTRSKIAANLNISPAPTKRILSDEERGSGENSPLTSGGNSSDSSGLGSHTFTSTQFGDDMADFRQANRTFAADSSTNQSKYKGINEDEATYNPKCTMKNPTSMNPGQPKNPSADDFTDNSKSTMEYSTSKDPGQPKNPSADDISYNPKSTMEYPTSLNPGQPKNPSANDFTYNTKTPMKYLTSMNPGQPKNLSADDITYNPKSTMKYPTSKDPGQPNSTTDLNKIPLSTSLLVDPAVRNYVLAFEENKIKAFLDEADVEMKTEKGEGFYTVILTAKKPTDPFLFYRVAKEISQIFQKFQDSLRIETITTSSLSSSETEELISYLFHCGIHPLEHKNTLEVTGCSKDLLKFLEKWASAKGDFSKFKDLTNLGIASGAQTQKPGLKERTGESGANGRSRRPDIKSRSKTIGPPPWH